MASAGVDVGLLGGHMPGQMPATWLIGRRWQPKTTIKHILETP